MGIFEPKNILICRVVEASYQRGQQYNNSFWMAVTFLRRKRWTQQAKVQQQKMISLFHCFKCNCGLMMTERVICSSIIVSIVVSSKKKDDGHYHNSMLTNHGHHYYRIDSNMTQLKEKIYTQIILFLNGSL